MAISRSFRYLKLESTTVEVSVQEYHRFIALVPPEEQTNAPFPELAKLASQLQALIEERQRVNP